MQNKVPTNQDSSNTHLVGKPTGYPLSAAQEALWYLHQQSTIGAAYRTAFASSIHSVVDVALLQQAIQALFERHSSLRSTITFVEDRPCQVIQEGRSVDFVQILCPSDEDETALRQRVQCAYAAPFDLEQGPLFRVRLFTRAATEHVLLVSAHLLIMDDLSMCLLLEELSLLYHALVEGVTPQLPALQATYPDFVAWEKDALQQQGDALWHYWQETVSKVEPLQLPLDRPRPASQSYQGASYYFQLPSELLQKLEALNGVATATLHNKLLTAFQILLYRYSGQSHFAVGIPSANRLRPEFQRLVGYLTNLLPIGTEIAADRSFYQLLQETTRRIFAATMHQNLPFSHMVARLNPEQDLSYSPITQVIFGFLPSPKGLSGYYVASPQHPSRHLTQWGSLQLSPFALPQQEGQFDLVLELEEEADRLLGRFKYNIALFDEATIARMVDHFVVLLQGIVSCPERPVAQLPMLTDAEYHQIVYEWNDTAVDFGQPQTIHALFEQQVARTPDAVAVVMGSRNEELGMAKETNTIPNSSFLLPNSQFLIPNSLTYAELNTRANQLAHHLIDLGVKPDTLVAVMMERSLEMVVSLLGILKAGAAYLPIDPAHPGERIAYLLQDSQTSVLLTTSALAHTLSGAAVTQVQLDTLDLAAYAITNPVTGVQPASAAYLIYTSGSTGQPKGVLMPHQAIWNLCQWQRQILPDPARTLQQSAITFDVACQELFTCWHTGGTLLLIQEELRRDLPALLDFLAAAAVERIFLPYVLLNALAEQATTQHRYPATLRDIITAGEQLIITPAIARWLEGLPAATLHNHYGPTETHVATAYTLENNPAQWPVWAPIGRPIANMTTYLLDDGQTPVPIGVPGELYIGGAQLACGYHNRPALTAERFIYHPQFGRLYKTGDLCRWLPDGTLEYIGRTDFQVKIRGFRIELGEIESALLAQVGVREAVVLVREDTMGDKRLVAYLVGEAASDTLRQSLAQRLPKYMLPSAFVRLEAMPLTPNGKLDRKALPRVPTERDYTAAQSAFVAPRTAMESKVAAIWQEVLGIKQVGVYDNFFALGGHSLLATQVIARLRSQLGLDISLKSLFETSQLGEFASTISRAGGSDATAIQPVMRESPLPLSFVEEEMWRLSQLQTEGSVHRYNLADLTRFTGQLDVKALRQSFHALIARHEILRTGYHQTADGVVPCIASSATVDLPLFDLSALTPQAQWAELERFRTVEETQSPDLTQTPRLRLRLVRLAPEEHILIVTTHHISGDNWSVSIIVHELGIFYASIVTGEPVSLAPLPFQYADYASWQRRFFTPEVLSERQQYWQRVLAKPLTLLQLPTDRPRALAQQQGAYHAQMESIVLPSALCVRIRQVSQMHHASVSMFLLAAYATLLYSESGCMDLFLASPTNKRNQPGTELLVGHFAGLAFLRLDLSALPSFAALLAHVKQTVVDALTYQDINLRQLLQVTGSAWLPHSRPQFHAAFNFLQQEQRITAHWPGLTVTPVETEHSHIAADVALVIWEESTTDFNYHICGKLRYRQDLFEAATIRRMSKNFQNLLEMFVAEPTRPIAQSMLATGAQSSLPSQKQHNQDINYDKPIHVPEHA